MPGRQSTGPPSIKKIKGKKRTQKRSLNALAIAEQQHPTKTKLRQNRLGASEAESSGRKRDHEEDDSDADHDSRTSKRPRVGDKDHFGNDIDGGSDSDGNEWVLGAVGEDDDSDLDSDEAMRESDEERFEGFTFRGSSSSGFKKLQRTSRQSESTGADNLGIDLNEDDGQDKSAEESDGLGDDAVDLADAMDEGLSSDYSSGSDDEGGSDDHVFSDLSDHEDAIDPKKLADLETFVSSMNDTKESQVHPKSVSDSHESIIPSEYGITSKQKLTLADLQSSITDPELRKSLKLISDDTKTSSKRKGMPKKLEVPLAKRQQDRLNRAAAYEKSKETLNRWIDTVKHNRRAEHISFPLKNNVTIPQGSHTMLPTVNSKPVTDLENEIQNILQESGLGPVSRTAEEDTVDTFTELPTNKLSLEEVQARTAELRRARDLLFREEKRAKRIKKIKSKSYRKVHRKERERMARSEKEALVAGGFEDSESEQERNDRRRAEERMGQRHRESRWAKSVKDAGRAAWDEDARTGVTEMARRGEELRKRMEGKVVDEDGSSSESESIDDQEDDVEDMEMKNKSRTLGRLQEIDDEGNGKENLETRLSSMPFMKKAEAFRQDLNRTAINDLRRELDGEETPSEEEAAEPSGRRSYGPLQNKTAKDRASDSEHVSEFEEKPASEDENEIRFEDDGEDLAIIVDAANPASKSNTNSPSISRQHAKQPPSVNKPSSMIEDNPWLSTTSHRHKKDRIAQDSRAEAIISNFPSTTPALPSPSIQPPKPRSALKGARAAAAAQEHPTTSPNHTTPTLADPSHTDSEDSASENAQPLLSKNHALIRRAFAGDAVVSDFATEKANTIANEETKITDNTLPGWGSWVGAGVSKHDRKRHTGRFLTRTPGIDAEARKDAKLDKVIINEKRVKKNGRYLATQLPHPFETRAQYERALRLPLGPEWTTKETYQGMTMPRVLLKQGVVEPMRRPVV
ncbi:MAG: hypothetical protein HETSPECPRED_002757 [Heterodermia speciosa]|uniref:Utp14-domain-containing protein n=1 Tax=Heterodermia speciosa TaxID=116794 RepID=A0A8H3F2P5_9LECA|nr:MAG: hypothetical protein HETSPECPRED_002757 [Heterodermia speciosa]